MCTNMVSQIWYLKEKSLQTTVNYHETIKVSLVRLVFVKKLISTLTV